MKTGRNFENLKKEIVALSVAHSWEPAKQEWFLITIDIDESCDSTCLCKHYPIRELCTLGNRLNHNEAIVGSVCVNRFMGLPTGKILLGH